MSTRQLFSSHQSINESLRPIPLLPLHRSLQSSKSLLSNADSIIDLAASHTLALQPAAHLPRAEDLLPVVDLRRVQAVHPNAIFKPVPQLALFSAPQFLISNGALTGTPIRHAT